MSIESLIKNIPITTEEKEQLRELLSVLYPPDDEALRSAQEHFQRDPHGHIIAIVSMAAAIFPDTEAAFHKALVDRLQLPYLDPDTVRRQLERSISELSNDPAKTRFVDAMQYALAYFKSSMDQEPLANR